MEGPAAAVAIMSHLICYCSIPSAACIWYIDFLPPHTVWGLSPVPTVSIILNHIKPFKSFVSHKITSSS